MSQAERPVPEVRGVLLIQCADTAAVFTLTADGSSSWRARIEASSLTAEGSVYAWLGEGIGDFFASLARDWRGWSGTRTWQSLEGELTIRATIDRLGHAKLQVDMLPDVFRWHVDVSLTVGAGQLEELAKQAFRLVAATKSSPEST